MNLQTVLIKPYGSFCNLNCEYCFYLEKKNLYDGPPSQHKMTEAVMNKLIRNAFDISASPVFVWHGGEPTLMGLDFFKEVVRFQQWCAHGRSYANAIQTNGLLLNDQWADFFKDENFLVGISVDGPGHVHDRYRMDKNGSGTFDKVFEKAKLLLEKGVQVNVLATVNAYSVNFPKEIYHFFSDNGFNFMQFSPVVESNPDSGQAAPFSVTANEYGRFLNELFQLWVNDFDFKNLRQKTSIRFFDSLIQLYSGMIPDHCIFQKACGNYLVIEHNGDIFSCDYLVSPETLLGNLNETSLGQAFRSPKHIAFQSQKAELDPECGKCTWLKLCYGGCIKDRVRDPEDKGRNRFCRSYHYFFTRADKKFQKFASLYKQYYQ
jgi:uncharacterized protein